MKQQPDAVHDVLQQAEDITSLPGAIKQCKKNTARGLEQLCVTYGPPMDISYNQEP